MGRIKPALNGIVRQQRIKTQANLSTLLLYFPVRKKKDTKAMLLLYVRKTGHFGQPMHAK
jgi:hypothetical protein